MELNDFIAVLEEALIKRGLSPEEAEKQILRLRRNFGEDDLEEIKGIKSESQIERIADNMIRLRKRDRAQAEKTAESIPDEGAHEPPKQKTAPSPALPHEFSDDEPSPSRQNRTRQNPSRSRSNPSPDKTNGQVSKGFYIFWLTFIFTLPITIALAAAFFGLFVGVFAALSALIVALIAGLIVLVAVGVGVALVGIIFGITQLFSFVAAGIYEIGLGVMVIGIVMLTGILIYNFAIRFLPWVIRKVAVLLRFTCGKIRDLFVYLRRECYKL